MTDAWNRTLRRRYQCQRLSESPPIDGDLAHPAWAALPWTDEFVDITGANILRPRYRTRAKMGWDERFFYVGARSRGAARLGDDHEK